MSDYTEITDEHFGVIYTGNMPNRVDLETFLDAGEYTGITAIRWPGGTLAEKGFLDPESATFYDLTVPDLMENRSGSGNDPAGFTEVMAAAVANGFGFTLIIPTLSYAYPEKGGSLQAPNLDLAFAEYQTFLEQLLVEQVWGPLPAEFTLEIGNEASLHFGDDQDIYGQIANTFLKAYDTVLRENDIEDTVSLAMQMGISSNQSMNQIVIDEIDDDLAGHIDAVRNHELNKGHGLSWDKGWAGLNDAAKMYYEEWLEKTGKTEDTLDHYVSAWNTGRPVERDASGAELALDPAAVDYGMKELSAVVEMFANFSLLSVDQAAHWGVAVSASHPNETSSVDGKGVITYAPKAEVLRLMSQNLVGTTLAHDMTKDADGNQLRKGHFRSDEDEVLDPEALRVFIFEDDDKYVVYVAANRFETLESDGETTFTIDLATYLDDPEAIVAGWSDHVTSDVAAFDFEDTTRQDVGITTRQQIDVSEQSFSVTLSQNYELAQVTLFKEGGDLSGIDGSATVVPGADVLRPTLQGLLDAITDPGTAFGELDMSVWAALSDPWGAGRAQGTYDDLVPEDFETVLNDDPGMRIELADPKTPFATTTPVRGSALNDLMRGASGRDTFYGEAGRDVLLGGDSADQIFGGADEDILGGQGGNDLLEGGTEQDFLFGGAGDDILRGSQGEDTLLGQLGDDILIGGAGSDLLSGGAGADLFVFDGGADIILDFETGTDRLEIADGFDTFALAQNAMSIGTSQIGTVLDFGNGNSLTLLGVADFDAGDLLFT